MMTTMNQDLGRKEALPMDAWTELNQAVIRDRIREREVEAAGERLASIARSAAAVAAAVRLLVASRRPAFVEPTRLIAHETDAAECAECPAVSNAA
jgi:hypothetical protein